MAVYLWFIIITAFAAIVFEITCMSEVFKKADKPGWACIVPVYGVIVLCDIAGKPRWWALLCLIPIANIVAYILLSLSVARHFERSDGFGVGLVPLPIIIYAVLAFDDSDYSPHSLPEETMVTERAFTASPVASPQQRPVSASDPVKQQRGLARCPSCRSTSFNVVVESGSRRCSNCHSILPGYIHGNR